MSRKSPWRSEARRIVYSRALSLLYVTCSQTSYPYATSCPPWSWLSCNAPWQLLAQPSQMQDPEKSGDGEFEWYTVNHRRHQLMRLRLSLIVTVRTGFTDNGAHNSFLESMDYSESVLRLLLAPRSVDWCQCRTIWSTVIPVRRRRKR